jgi:hypothetical protein
VNSLRVRRACEYRGLGLAVGHAVLGPDVLAPVKADGVVVDPVDLLQQSAHGRAGEAQASRLMSGGVLLRSSAGSAASCVAEALLAHWSSQALTSSRAVQSLAHVCI